MINIDEVSIQVGVRSSQCCCFALKFPPIMDVWLLLSKAEYIAKRCRSEYQGLNMRRLDTWKRLILLQFGSV